MALATASSLLGDQLLYAVLPSHYTALNLLPYQVGVLLSANRWIRLLTNHVAERCCRHQAPALLLTLALGLGSMLTMLYAVTSSFTLLLAGRILWGLCWSFIRQIGLMTVVDSVMKQQAARWIGVYSSISRVGSLGGNLLGALGHDYLGYGPTLVLFAVISLCAVPLGPLSRRGLRPPKPRTKPHGQALRIDLGLLFCGFIVGCVGPGLIMSTLGLVLTEKVGTELVVGSVVVGVATLTGLLLGCRWVAELAGPVLGTAADRVGRRWAAMGYFLSGGLALAVASQVEAAALLVILVVLFFICSTGATVALVARAGLAGSRSVSRYVTAADLGSATGPLVGWMGPQFGFPAETAFAVAAILFGAGAVSVLLAPSGTKAAS